MCHNPISSVTCLESDIIFQNTQTQQLVIFKQLLKCKDLLLFFVVYVNDEESLGVVEWWLDKRSDSKTSLWACDEHFSQLCTILKNK